MTVAEMKARIAELEAQKAKAADELASLKKTANSTISFSIGEKGGVQVNGLGRFPVTLYDEQWDRLVAAIPALNTFRATHKGHLASKGVPYVRSEAAKAIRVTA